MDKIEDSLKGLLITLGLIALFATSMLSYIVLFPMEQGVNFNDVRSNNTYLTIQGIANSNITGTLATIQNNTDNAFNNWDITVGFMGSNTLKQGQQIGASNLNTNVFTTILGVAGQLFGSGSPIIYAITVISGIAGIVITLLVIKFVRQGN